MACRCSCCPTRVLLLLLNEMEDQPALSQRMAELGAGLQLDGETATAAEIRAAVDWLTGEPSFGEAAQR